MSKYSLATLVAIAKFTGKMQKKSGIMKIGLEAMPLFLLDDLLKNKDAPWLMFRPIFVKNPKIVHGVNIFMFFKIKPNSKYLFDN